MVRNALSPFGGSYGRDPFFSLQREMNRLFDDALRGFGGLSASSGQQPQQAGGLVEARLNVSETDKELRISAELPGVDEKDVDVTLDGDLLTIRGEKTFEQERGGDKESYHVVERSYGSFQRSLQLPYAVKSEDVRAEFHNGVLTLTLPKSEQQQRSHKIPISAGSSAQQQIASAATEGEPQERPIPERNESGVGEQPMAH
jgi:HSP20 family protein